MITDPPLTSSIPLFNFLKDRGDCKTCPATQGLLKTSANTAQTQGLTLRCLYSFLTPQPLRTMADMSVQLYVYGGLKGWRHDYGPTNFEKINCKTLELSILCSLFFMYFLRGKYHYLCVFFLSFQFTLFPKLIHCILGETSDCHSLTDRV